MCTWPSVANSPFLSNSFFDPFLPLSTVINTCVALYFNLTRTQPEHCFPRSPDTFPTLLLMSSKIDLEFKPKPTFGRPISKAWTQSLEQWTGLLFHSIILHIWLVSLLRLFLLRVPAFLSNSVYHWNQKNRRKIAARKKCMSLRNQADFVYSNPQSHW